MRHLHSAFICTTVHSKHFTIISWVSPQPPPVWHDWQGPMGGMWPGHWGYTPTLLQEVPWEF